MDKELLKEFILEIQSINVELKNIVDEQMKKKVMDLTLFEKYGQCIDRIYGTSTTLGFMELGKYAKSMKDVCYLCSQSEHEVAQKKVLRMMMECNDILDKVPAALLNTVEFKKFSRVFLVETTKAERMEKIEFQNIKRKSLAS